MAQTPPARKGVSSMSAENERENEGYVRGPVTRSDGSRGYRVSETVNIEFMSVFDFV